MNESTKGLQPHELRVVYERKELIEKITKLHAFMASDFYQTLDKETQDNFEEQENAMKKYCDVLLKRINRFEGTIENTVIELTFGEKAVGYAFNPSGDEDVSKAKKLIADAIDLLETVHNKKTSNGAKTTSWFHNVFRTQTFNALIAAQMAVVKFITWKE